MARNQKPKKDSLITLTRKYANNHDECVKYFFKLSFYFYILITIKTKNKILNHLVSYYKRSSKNPSLDNVFHILLKAFDS